MNTRRKPRIGLALGSGSARGWAHVGVIRALERAGIRPDLVCGTSIGALVAAAYVAGEIESFEQWLLGLGVRDVIALLDVRMNGGMIKGERLMEFFRRNFTDRPIEELPMPYGAVATDLNSGAEVWLRQGSTLAAVRASIALPALFAPALHEGRVLVDGALVNPVPVSLARAMGADIVIAVDLSSDILGRRLREELETEAPAAEASEWRRKLQERLSTIMPARAVDDAPKLPSILEVVATSLSIMQVRVTRSRMAGDPPDAIVAPRLSHLGLLDFHRAKDAIEAGELAVETALPGLNALFKLSR
jgi:NTE family protein